MKISKFFAVLTVLAFTFAPAFVHAQDAPPPPPDAGGPPSDAGAPAPGDDQGASFQQFYDQLGSQGNWVQSSDYGYVFQPNVSDPNWAPYTDGHWVYSDQGWVWASDEPWGWATYHYGRWANIDGMGWVWVPGYRWAPAWVSWRYGGGYCGWAPLPPDTFIGAEYGDPGFDAWATFHFGGDVDLSFNIGPGCYNFVRVGDFGARNYRGHFIDRSRNFTVINNTTNITNINISRNGAAAGNFRGVSVGGPRINDINAFSHDRVQTVRLAEAAQPGRSTLQGNTLSIYSPRVNAATLHTARPAQVSQTIDHPTFNRGDSITKPLEVTRNVRAAAPSPAAIQEAQAARLHAPANARIATENTVSKATFNKPITALQTVTPRRETGAAPGANAFNQGAQHSAVNSPYTGESQQKPAVQHSAVNSPNTFEPQEKPAVQHTTVNPYTGETANHEQQVQHTQGQNQTEINQQAIHQQQERVQQQQRAEAQQQQQQQRAEVQQQQQRAEVQQQQRSEPQVQEHIVQHTQTQAQPQQEEHVQQQHAPVQQQQAVHTQAEPKAAPQGGSGGGQAKKDQGNGQNNQGNH